MLERFLVLTTLPKLPSGQPRAISDPTARNPSGVRGKYKDSVDHFALAAIALSDSANAT